MATSLNVIYRIAADISGLESGVARAAKATEGLEGLAKSLQSALTAAFTIGAVAKLATDVLNFAGTLEDLSAQTGISTDALQKFDLAFSQAGVSLDTVATNATKLAKALVEGDKSTVGALEKLGLSVTTLKQQKPEDQFIAVADAIGRIENPTEKAWAAMQVFGKGGAELLKALDGHLADTTQQFEAMGLIVDAETVKSIDTFGDQMGLLGKQLIAVTAQIVGPLMPALTALANGLMLIANIIGPVLGMAIKGLYGGLLLLISTFERFVGGLLGAVAQIPWLGKQLGIVGDAAKFLGTAANETDAEIVRLFDSTTKGGDAAAKATPKLLGLGKATDAVKQSTKEADQAARDAARAWEDLLRQLQAIEGTKFELKTLALADALKEMGKAIPVVTMKDLATFTLRAATDVPALTGSIEDLQRQGRFGSAALLELNKQVMLLPAGINPATTAVAKWRDEQEHATEKTKETKDVLKDLADAFTRLAQVTGGGLSDFARGMGTIVTALDLAAKGTDAWAGGLANLKVGEAATGVSQMTTALVSMTAALIQATSSTSVLQSTLGGALTGAQIGSIIPGIGTGIGAAAGAIVGFVRAMSADRGGVVRQIHDANDALVTLHGGFANLEYEARLAGTTLSGIFSATTINDYNKALLDLQQALDFQNASMRTLDETVKKYGFTLNELGPTLQRQELDKQAQQIYQDFQVLTTAGIDTTTVLEHMSEAVNKFVQNSIAMGTEVPIAMKPMLQHMIDLGLLVDKNGKAFTSLEDAGITFSETMTQGFNRLIEVVDRLTKAIARGLGVALDELPDQTNVTVGVHTQVIPGDPVHAATGGTVTSSGLRPVSWTPSGTDIIPAMLSPGEVVLTPAQQAAIWQGAQGGGQTTTFNFAISTLDASDFQTVTEQKIFPAIVNQLRRGRGLTAMKDVLG